MSAKRRLIGNNHRAWRSAEKGIRPWVDPTRGGAEHGIDGGVCHRSADADEPGGGGGGGGGDTGAADEGVASADAAGGSGGSAARAPKKARTPEQEHYAATVKEWHGAAKTGQLAVCWGACAPLGGPPVAHAEAPQLGRRRGVASEVGWWLWAPRGLFGIGLRPEGARPNKGDTATS